MDLYGEAHLIVFARLPSAGQSKTRLIPAVGERLAAGIYRYLALRSLKHVELLARQHGCRVTIWFTGADADAMAEQFPGPWKFQAQSDGDLGARLEYAFEQEFARGAHKVVVVGTDCLDLNATDLVEAFARLEESDVVFGPAKDGGYYLLGSRCFDGRLFRDIAWSTPQVLVQTIRKCEFLELSYGLLAERHDVDLPSDLVGLRQQLQQEDSRLLDTRPGRLSIVIPTLNEAENLPATLSAIGPPSDRLEIIVADGGSEDATHQISQDFGCRFVLGPNRAQQLNIGAAVSTGEYILFVHADTILPDGYQALMVEALRGGCIATAFALSIDDRNPWLRAIEWSVRQRCRWLQLPYGDQALGMTSNTFFQLGGFKPWPIMEDYEFVTRLRRRGKIGLLPTCVRTSARRWQERGVLRVTLINQICLAAYYLGWSPERIAALYRRSSRQLKK